MGILKIMVSSAIPLAICVLGCSSSPPTVIRNGGQYAAPESLVVLASSVRGAGGAVFVGTPHGAPVALDPEIAPAPGVSNVFISMPREAVQVTVVNDLGTPMDSEMMVSSVAGPSSLVDASGAPATSYVLESDDRWQQYELPTEGEWVFFVTFDADGFAVTNWRAQIQVDGMVDGANTNDGLDRGLSELMAH